eukprot:TRINITY_DN11639_c0_g1_i1.p1 TRINITY_DN11639_c0_g1~~TRINITY_DN11639_c0_g1_i1.p1  ORF type:complete len:363 (+),score=57.44 TRINITY_DN11639_c0_g1_i1:155-1243(+)
MGSPDLRRQELGRLFDLFAKNGEPLDAVGVIPLGKVLRGQDWDPSLAPTLLGRMDLDGDGEVNRQDFVEFLAGRLREVTDEEFARCIERLRNATGGSPDPAQLVVSVHTKLIGAAVALVAIAWIAGYRAHVLFFASCAALGWFGWHRLAPTPLKQQRVKTERTRVRSRKKGSKGSKSAKKTQAPRGAVSEVEPEQHVVSAVVQEDVEEEAHEASSSSEEDDEDDYDLGLLLGQGSGLPRAVKPRAARTQVRLKPKPKQAVTSTWREPVTEPETFEHQDWNSVGWNNTANTAPRESTAGPKGQGTSQKLSKNNFIALDEATEASHVNTCLLYTSDAADEEDSVDLGGRRIIKKKKKKKRRRRK